MIRGTLKGASKKKSSTSVFYKILLNHIQIVVLTASFDFKWPPMVVQYFSASKPVGEVTSQIISIDCFVAT